MLADLIYQATDADSSREVGKRLSNDAGSLLGDSKKN